MSNINIYPPIETLTVGDTIMVGGTTKVWDGEKWNNQSFGNHELRLQELEVAKQFTNIDAVKAYSKLSKLIGQRITTGEYHAGTGYGGATYEVVSAGSVTPNDIDIIQGVADSGAAIVLVKSSEVALSTLGFKNYTDASTIVSGIAPIDFNIKIDVKALWYGELVCYGNVSCEGYGAIVFDDQTDTLLHITTSQTGDSISTGSVSGLTELSNRVAGFNPKPNGFAVIDSNEELIKRTIGGFYTKDELIVFSDEAGNLSVPVYENHDVSQIGSITYYNPEKPVLLRNVVVETVDGDFRECNINGIIKTSLRSVVTDGVEVNNIRNTWANFLNTKCPNHVFKCPKMDGSKIQEGYGINNQITGSTLIINPQMGRFRRAITGRHDKNTHITGGGWVRSVIDSHYGYNFSVDGGVTVEGEIKFAGRDISVTRINHIGGNGGIIQRNDTPETKGRVEYSNNSATLTGGVDWSGYVFGASGTFDFGRELKQCDLLVVEGNKLTAVEAPSAVRWVWQIQPQACEISMISNVIIGSNVINSDAIGYTITPEVVRVAKADNISGSSKITYSGESLGVLVVDDLTTAFDRSKGFNITVRDIDSVAFRVDSTALLSGLVRNSKVTRLDNNQSADLSANILGTWDLRTCNLLNLPSQNHKSLMSYDGFLQTVPDDSAQVINLSDFNKQGTVSIYIPGNQGRGGSMMYDSETLYSIGVGVGANFEVVTGALSGSTGVDGKVTASVDNGVLYIENRSGSAKNIIYRIV